MNREEKEWPRDPHGYVFLGRALDEIGCAKFSQWTGDEPTTEYVDHLSPALANASLSDKIEAGILLRKYRQDLRPIAWVHQFTDEQWQAAHDLALRLHHEQLPARKRLDEVLVGVVKANETGNLALWIRPVSGGSWRVYLTDWWNTGKWRSRFINYKIDPDYPFSDRPSWKENNDHWIFVTRDSLDRFLGRKPVPEPEVELALRKKREIGKRPRIKVYLRERFPRDKFPKGVPDPAHCPRLALKADLVKWDPQLNPLDEGTLKSAIDEYNNSLKPIA